MTAQHPFTKLLSKMEKSKSPELNNDEHDAELKELQFHMLRSQQGLFHLKDRVIIAIEGFDAAGKGGCIRKITELLDPRGVRVIPIGAPSAKEQGKHWLYRFWKKLPAQGDMTIFDRTWYGRVLVEKVEKITPEEKLRSAYDEINQFEAMLQSDGIIVIKIFLAITKDEQKERFQDRLKDPYKQWKITLDDMKMRKKWPQYVKAVDELLVKTSTDNCPWHVIAANSKKNTRLEVLKIITAELSKHRKFMEQSAGKQGKTKLSKLLNDK